MKNQFNGPGSIRRFIIEFLGFGAFMAAMVMLYCIAVPVWG
jgi:hypothetical protein